MKRTLLFIAVLLFGSIAGAQSAQHSVTLSWAWAQGTGDPAFGFHVQRSATAGGPYAVIASVPVATLMYIDSSVKAGEKWYYVVTAYNSGGDSLPTAEVSALIPFQAPTTPSGLTAVPK